MEKNKEKDFRERQKVKKTDLYQPKDYLKDYKYSEKEKRHDEIMRKQRPASDYPGHDM